MSSLLTPNRPEQPVISCSNEGVSSSDDHSLPRGNPRQVKDTKTPDSLPEPSCFDMLNILRSRFYVERETLWSCVTMATKDEAGCLNWITLRVAEHHKYVSVATSLILGGVHRPSLIPMVKRTLFVFLLEVLSGEDSSSFLKLQSGRVLDQRAQQEKRRLAVKRKRAAKRERVRKESKNPASKEELAKRDSIATRTCQACSVTFRGQKQLKYHTCKKAVVETVPETGSTPRAAEVALPVESPPRSSTPHSVCSTQVTASSGKSLSGDKLLAFQALVARRPEFGTMRRSELDEGQKVYNRETCCCGFRFWGDGRPMHMSTQNHLTGRSLYIGGGDGGAEWVNEPRRLGHYAINSLIL
ncbi:uncharacterized protein F5891DRAFT_1049857 [Suillus fuscotomentosus]|uniref:Uncharacterized protein n=1 Tax=Suillus fuscotomentosus TaxID=1912939 RepID=A0AAD4E0D7_9AGAM|nr:uncharacterized protein F5891DRAFT_1049857 [Suillus fuscotomentosus]KAG1897230.1 hypothetical protein F5891DRAFT_1049857 [Suillus fuscotomentosus]